MAMIPVAYFPAPTQQVFAANQRRVHGTPYAEFFTNEMFLRSEVVPALRAPMDPRHALACTDLARLLDPGHHAVETGYCLLPDGTAYVASRTVFPGASGDMLAWWFWWFMAEPERYALWHPYGHVSAAPVDGRRLTEPGLTHEQRYQGITLRGVEYIGAQLMKVKTHFVSPARWGLEPDRMAEAGIVAAVLGEISLGPLRVGRMLRLARNTDDGVELRTRFWIGDQITPTSRDNRLNLAPALRRVGLKGRLITATTAYEQLVNDQVGMTHLASLLPPLHHRFAA